MSDNLNKNFQNMNFNPRAQSFNPNPNAQSFNPQASSFQPGGGQGGYQQGGSGGGGGGGYQQNNSQYQAGGGYSNQQQGGYQGHYQQQQGYSQGGYQSHQQAQGYEGQGRQGGYQGNQNNYQAGGYRGGHRGGHQHRGAGGQGFNYNQNHNQGYQGQHQQGYQGHQNQNQPGPFQEKVVASGEPSNQSITTEQQQVPISSPVPAEKTQLQPEQEAPEDWDDEPEPVATKPETSPEKKTTSSPKAATDQKSESKKKDAANVSEENNVNSNSKSKEAKPETQKDKPKEETLAKRTMKNDAIPENMRKSDKEHLNVVFIGHVDAGKSTIGGQILKLTNMVDARTLEKFEREAKEKNRETWYLSWCLDQNQEEREKGKTVECGRAFFETENKHFTILDAPGHKSFVANMITGASQADVAVLVISARRGEFESGFELGGQTREHAMLVKTAGVKKLIVLINKMDESTVKWSKDRYDEIIEKLGKYLKKINYSKKEVYYLPGSGQTGINILKGDQSLHPYYKGASLIEYLDALPNFDRSSGEGEGVRLPIVGRYKDMGLMVFGKLEAGQIIRGQTYTLMPNKQMIKVTQILTDDIEVDTCSAGENVKLKLDGVEEEDISSGFVICDNNSLCHYSSTFDVKLKVTELNKPLMGPGFQAMLHIHTCTEEVTIKNLICKINTKTGEKEPFTKGKAKFLRDGDLGIVRMKTAGNICIETFRQFERMGRVSLRDEGKTLAYGTIVKVVE